MDEAGEAIQVRVEIVKMKRSPGNCRVRQEKDRQQNIEKYLNASLTMNWTRLMF